MTTNPLGPLFISYRHKDGAPCAAALARALRATGIPVWQDKTDLLPGEISCRLNEALNSGLSGAILLVTPGIRHSTIIKEIELPRLLELAEDPDFILAVAYVEEIKKLCGSYDYSLPDRLLDRTDGALKNFKQLPASTAVQRAELAAEFLRHRLRLAKSKSAEVNFSLNLDIQTRTAPTALSGDPHLMLRLSPPDRDERRPNPKGLQDFAAALEHLPQAVSNCRIKKISVRGGAHLSVAFALGAAFPTTRIGEVEVIDTKGEIWRLTGQAPAPQSNPLTRIANIPLRNEAGKHGGVLIYADLLPERSDSAVKDFLDINENNFAGAAHLVGRDEKLLDPIDTPALVGELNSTIRDLAEKHNTREVHLLLRCPFPVAIQLGRVLNTLSVHLYEWENSSNLGTAPRYFHSMFVQPGVGGSPIRSVTATLTKED